MNELDKISEELKTKSDKELFEFFSKESETFRRIVNKMKCCQNCEYSTIEYQPNNKAIMSCKKEFNCSGLEKWNLK